MSSKRHLTMAILSLVAVVALGGVSLVWPSYREAARHNRQTTLLHHKGENYDVQARRIASLSRVRCQRALHCRFRRSVLISPLPGLCH